MIISGPGAGCDASNFTLRSIKTLAPQGLEAPLLLDFVLSRTDAVPASRLGKFPAFNLPGHGNGSGPVAAVLDSVYFQSDAGYVLNGLAAGDSVTGTFWDGNPSFFDCGDALLFPRYISLGYGKAELGLPLTAGRAATGFTGAAMVTSATFKSSCDLAVFNSASFVAQDWYSESNRGNLYLSGSPSDAPGRVVVGAAKVNTNVGFAALAVDGYGGLVMQIGANVAYQRWNISVEGATPSTIVLLGSKAWFQDLDLNVTAVNVNLSIVANIAGNNTWDGWIPDVEQPGALSAAALGFDAFRELGAWDVATYFPGGYGTNA